MTIRPGAPAYLEMPYAASDVANGATADPRPTAPAAIKAFSDEVIAKGRRPLISDITEEKPLPADTEDALFQAADKAYRIAAGRIKFHEEQLRRWRAVAASFAGLSGGSAPNAAVPADVAQQFLDLVSGLPEGTT